MGYNKNERIIRDRIFMGKLKRPMVEKCYKRLKEKLEKHESIYNTFDTGFSKDWYAENHNIANLRNDVEQGETILKIMDELNI